MFGVDQGGGDIGAGEFEGTEEVDGDVFSIGHGAVDVDDQTEGVTGDGMTSDDRPRFHGQGVVIRLPRGG